MNNGKFVISLDFELQWGMIDHITKTSPYRENILNVHKVVPRLIDVFEKYNIHCTFAAVGFLFFNNYNHLVDWLEGEKERRREGEKERRREGEKERRREGEKERRREGPSYNNQTLNACSYFEQVKSDETEYYFAPDLIEQISKHPNFEIASHTFSHYYCLEKGQTIDDFRRDLQMAKKIAKENGIDIKSLVFPRNQINEEYLQICREEGFETVRSNEKSWMYRASAGNENTKWKRLFRLLDNYINLSGHNCYSSESLKSEPILEIPASRFLRPYSRKLSFLEGLRLNRIKNDMTYAAKSGKIFHLWWHPHNFGARTEENFMFLGKILEHYEFLKLKYDFESCTMKEILDYLN
jgi:peptidoglycan/xylan/chitin deacetylase (PgdA/CDA1 family)